MRFLAAFTTTLRCWVSPVLSLIPNNAFQIQFQMHAQGEYYLLIVSSLEPVFPLGQIILIFLPL